MQVESSGFLTTNGSMVEVQWSYWPSRMKYSAQLEKLVWKRKVCKPPNTPPNTQRNSEAILSMLSAQVLGLQVLSMANLGHIFLLNFSPIY